MVRTLSINANADQCRSKFWHSDQCPGFDRHWALIDGVLKWYRNPISFVTPQTLILMFYWVSQGCFTPTTVFWNETVMRNTSSRLGNSPNKGSLQFSHETVRLIQWNNPIVSIKTIRLFPNRNVSVFYLRFCLNFTSFHSKLLSAPDLVTYHPTPLQVWLSLPFY